MKQGVFMSMSMRILFLLLLTYAGSGHTLEIQCKTRNIPFNCPLTINDMKLKFSLPLPANVLSRVTFYQKNGAPIEFRGSSVIDVDTSGNWTFIIPVSYGPYIQIKVLMDSVVENATPGAVIGLFDESAKKFRGCGALQCTQKGM
jgi:hypothetical protein